MKTLLVNEESLNYLTSLPDNSVDAVVTDPPYGLSQLKQKEYLKVMEEWAKGNLNYTPTKKGIMCKLWDGFVPPPALWVEVLRVLKSGGHALVFAGARTQDLMGLSLRIAGFEIRDCLQWLYGSGFPKSFHLGKAVGEQWEGWGTALKPAYEPILLVRKPLDGTIKNNILAHGVGGLNIDACRITTTERERFPANVFLGEDIECDEWKRFFYCPKASKSEKESGLEGFEKKKSGSLQGKEFRPNKPTNHPMRRNHHPTVKPLKLMQYLVRLVTPKEGVVLDPFMGSGTTGIACAKEKFGFIGIELEKDYYEIAEARIKKGKS